MDESQRNSVEMKSFTAAWFGIHKLTEECGELLQLLGKLGAYPNGLHPDGKGSVKDRLPEELADVLAAVNYFIVVNHLDQKAIGARSTNKLATFLHWGLTGVVHEIQDPAVQAPK